MLLIFDCDGVLVDSENLASLSGADYLAELGAPLSAADIAERFIGIGQKDMIRALRAEFGARIPDDFGAQLTQRTLARFATDLQPVPGVRAAIESLPFPRCVASSSSLERIHSSLRTTGLSDLFAPGEIFSSSMVANGKPAPDIFLHAAREMKEEPSACIVIEDSIGGVTGSSAAGMRVIGFTGGAHLTDKAAHAAKLRAAGADVVIDNMVQLPALVAA